MWISRLTEEGNVTLWKMVRCGRLGKFPWVNKNDSYDFGFDVTRVLVVFPLPLAYLPSPQNLTCISGTHNLISFRDINQLHFVYLKMARPLSSRRRRHKCQFIGDIKRTLSSKKPFSPDSDFITFYQISNLSPRHTHTLTYTHSIYTQCMLTCTHAYMSTFPYGYTYIPISIHGQLASTHICSHTYIHLTQCAWYHNTTWW